MVHYRCNLCNAMYQSAFDGPVVTLQRRLLMGGDSALVVRYYFCYQCTQEIEADINARIDGAALERTVAREEKQ